MKDGRAGRYTHAAVDASRRRVGSVVVAVLVGVLLAALDATVVGTAMPTIIATLGGVALYPWVFAAYLLASTAVMPVFGGLSDRLGRRTPFVAAVAIFSAGSLLAGAAPTMLALIAGRGLQGLGAGGIFSLAIIIVGDLFPGARHGRMLGLLSAVWGVAAITGPILGGLIVDQWGWRWVFYLNLPFSAAVILLILLGFRETAPAGFAQGRRRLDLAGAALFLVGVTAVLLVFLQPRGGAGAGLLGPGRLMAAVVGLGALAAFVRVERTSDDPLVALALFREAPFAVGCLAGFFAGAAMFGAILHLPLLVQWGHGTDATTAGLSLMATSGGWALGSFAGGQLVNRFGFRRIAVSGMAVMTAGYLALAWRPHGTLRFLIAVAGVLGIGMGLVTITLIVAVQSLIRLEQRGIATSAMLFFRNIGGTVGVAAMGGMLTARLGVQVGEGAGALPPALAAAFVVEMGAVLWLGVGSALLGLAATCFLPPATPLSRRPGGAMG